MRQPLRCIGGGRTFTSEKEFSKGTVGTSAAITDGELIGKFRHNAARVFNHAGIEKAVQAFLTLEKIDNISQLMKEITLS